MDKITQQRANQVHPKLRAELQTILREVDAALTGKASIRITQAYRSIAEQNALYAQGRTVKGQKVTNAKGGQSNHNYGLAVDFCLIIDGNAVSWDMAKDYDGDLIPDWMEVVKIFKAHGWSWGGDWKSLKDYPHFEKTFGFSVSSLFKLVSGGDTIVDNGLIYPKI